jgi:flagellar biosynthesis GTPase FlhF
MCCQSGLNDNCRSCFTKGHEYEGWCNKCKKGYFKYKNDGWKCTEKKNDGDSCYDNDNCKSNKCTHNICVRENTNLILSDSNVYSSEKKIKEKNCNYKDHCYDSKCRTDNSDKPWCYLKENSKDICNIDGGSGYGNANGKNYSYIACNNWLEETKQEPNEENKQESKEETKQEPNEENKQESKEETKQESKEETKQESKEETKQEVNIKQNTKSNLDKKKMSFFEKNKLILFIVGGVFLLLLLIALIK